MNARPIILWSWILVLPLFVMGCESSPSAPEGFESAELLDDALVAIVTAESDALLLRVRLEQSADEWRAQAVGHADVGELLSLAATLRVQAGSAHAEGQSALAALLDMEAEAFVLRAGIALYGDAFAENAALEARRVLRRLQDVAASGRVSPDARGRLGQASSLVDHALVAVASGDGVQALASAVEASETMAGLSSEETARRWIGHAQTLLERATSLAGPDVGPPVSSWLQAAAQMLSQAVSSYESGNFQAATQQAKASAAKSRKVIDALTDGGGGGPEDLAARAIAMAQELLERAEATAGPDPAPQIQEALDRARALLADAKAAFAGGSFAEAARLARESAALSAWVIRQHLGGPPPIDSAETAERAIAQAQELLQRATDMAGPSPSAEIADALSRAAGKLAGAREAYDAGDYREAVRLARTSSSISSWVIRTLSG